MKTALTLCAAFAALLPAQNPTSTVPNLPSVTNVDRPFPGGIGRYQQWFSANALGVGFPDPIRITQVEFFAGTPPTSQVAQIDCEILLAHGKFVGVTGAFNSNYDSQPVTVKPRALETLSAGGTGAVVMTMPFAVDFTWDRVRPLLMEIRVFGNSLGNQPFAYNFRGSTISTGVINRVYHAGSTGAANGSVLNGVGMVTRFTGLTGAVVSFGTGCPGEGNIVPRALVGGLPVPASTWTHQLVDAASQRLAIWVFGTTNQAPFPIDLPPLFGFAPSNCFLRTDPAVTAAVMTVGGGAGAGIAQLQLQLPGTGLPSALRFYTQWVVFDPAAPSGIVSVTAGNLIVTP